MLIYFRNNYLLFTKTNDRNPRGKKISMSRNIWAEMQKHFNRVKEAKLAGKSLQIQLCGAKHLTLEKFSGNGIWYTGFHDLSPLDTIIPMSGMNFDEAEWDELMENVSEINDALAAENLDSSGTKRDHNGREIVRDVLMYRWKWISGKKKIDESKICFFTEEDCKADASMNKPSAEKASVAIETVWGPPPKKFVHMHVVFIFILKKFIDKLVKQRCEGCNVDSPSQKDHMGEWGCLVEEVDYLKDHCEEGLQKITPSDLVTLYEKSRKCMGASSSYSDLSAETVIFYMDKVTAVHYLKQIDDQNRNIVMVLRNCSE